MLLLFCSEQGYAQNNLTLSAAPATSSIQIDGRLDEGDWQDANVATGFLQFAPNVGEMATQNTEVRVLYGEEHLFIGAILYDVEPGSIEQTLGRRDEYNRADWFLVSIDSYFNRQNAFTFGVNAAGIQLDGIRTGAGGGGGGGGGSGIPGVDTSWDAIWDSAVRVTDEGWVVEIQIPYSMLRFSAMEDQTWGVHFARSIARLGEDSEWPMVPRSDRGNLIARFGLLTDLHNIEPRPNIQIRPYTLTRLDRFEDPSSPGHPANTTGFELGGELKIGLTPSVTLDATINPDFGQVEADPSQLNLTAFETTFREQRPFFVEGMEMFSFSIGRGSLLYTRRIGAENPIIGAAKISGRTESGLTFGVLGATSGTNFQPTSNYGISRLSQQIGDFSSAGGILTLYDGPAERTSGRRQSIVIGTDWDLRFHENQYGFEGWSSLTHRGLTMNDHSETGFAGRLRLNKRQGYWTWWTATELFSDQFNPNDLGQHRQNNLFGFTGRVEHQLYQGQSFGPFRQARANAMVIQNFSYDEGLNLGLSLFSSSNWDFKGFQSIRTNIRTSNLFGGYDLSMTRGLGPVWRPFNLDISVNYGTDERKNWELGPSAGWTYHSDGGFGYELGIQADWDIGSRISLSGSLEGEWEQGVLSWTSNETFRRDNGSWLIGTRSASPESLGPDDFVAVDDQGLLDPILAGVTPYSPDAYYVPVFGRRDTRALDLTLRSTVTFIPNLSLQVYGQMFLARGRYDDFRIMQNRDDMAYFDPYPKRDEFSMNNLQSNVVLRWEYNPGSTMFLVWSHGRSARNRMNPLSTTDSSPYDRPIGTQIGDTFDIFPNNTFMVKVNYTFLY